MHLLRYGHRPEWKTVGTGKYDPFLRVPQGLKTICTKCRRDK